ncbi:MAG: hypothetical protein KAG89_02390 [Fulvimarina manganoxydans]|uniref:hypothetical protein n=1 Tax=Fulvimarina manganoxydans TaxID=937218 RepID=UPI00235232DE|nr:hypothetical protein [Fulvimarina manganoxydans]MCK5930993.1 hypothetical protein [Fulvimarina manganoxydans]
MKHTIKIRRAISMSSIGSLVETRSAMLEAIPASVLATASSRQIADLLDANWALAQRSKASAAEAACDEGAIWDANRQRLREIAA